MIKRIRDMEGTPMNKQVLLSSIIIMLVLTFPAQVFAGVEKAIGRIAIIPDADVLSSRSFSYTAQVQRPRGYTRNTNRRINKYIKPLPSPGKCTFLISSDWESVTAKGMQGSIAVTASPETCRWSVIEAIDWITIIDGAEGIGSGTVTYSVSPHSGRFIRVANITVAGLTFTVVQSAP